MWGACDYGANVQADTTASVYRRQSPTTQRGLEQLPTLEGAQVTRE